MLSEFKIIRDFSNNEYTFDEFITQIAKYNYDGYDFFVGTDSQVSENKLTIVTAICPRKIISDGTGISGRIFYIKERVPQEDYKNLRTRMLAEAYRSLEVSMDLEQYITTKISIHLDVNSDDRAKTQIYERELQYLVSSQGFDCKVKPESWAAGSVADKLSRH